MSKEKRDVLSSYAEPVYDFYKPRELAPEVAATVLDEFEPSLTRQEFAEECDINTIMARYERTGVIDHTSNRQPFYADFANMPVNLQDAMDVFRDAERAFMTLPAKVRKEFDNDAAAFVEFASNPDNLDQMRAWDLAPPAPKPEAPTGPSGAAPAEPGPPAGPAGGGAPEAP